MDMKAEQVGFPTTLSSHTRPKNTKPRQEGTSVMQPTKNQAKGDNVSLLSPVPILTCTHMSPKKPLKWEMK